MAGDKALSVKEHEEEWDEILNNVNGAVDIMAFKMVRWIIMNYMTIWLSIRNWQINTT